MGAKEDITAKVTAKGDELRELKKTKPAKEAVMKLVGELNVLKAEYQTIAGEPWPAPVAAPKQAKKGKGQPAPAPAPKAPSAGGGAKDAITAKVTAKGDELRELKKTKPAKEAVMKLVGELNALKAEYQTIAGEPWPAPVAAPQQAKKGKGQPAPAPAPKGKGQPAPAPAPGGVSKAAAAKAAKKAEAAAKKAEYKSGARTGSDFRATDAGAKVVVKPGGAAAAPDKIKVKLEGFAALSAGEVGAFLVENNLGKYADGFKAVDGQMLLGATDGRLEKLGMAFPPHRRKLRQLLTGDAIQSEATILAVQNLRARLAGLVGAAKQQGASAPPFDDAQKQASHRFYPMLGMSVMAQRAGGAWEQARISGAPKDVAAEWECTGGSGDAKWTERINTANLGPVRHFASSASTSSGGAQKGGAAADWRSRLPAAKGLSRMQLLPGQTAGTATSGKSGGSKEIAEMNRECDGLEARIAVLESGQTAKPALAAGPSKATLEITAKVNAKGDELREFKKTKPAKDDVMKLVKELNSLKAEYAKIAGEPWPK